MLDFVHIADRFIKRKDNVKLPILWEKDPYE